MSLLLVLRHGPTEWNARGAIQGRADPPLSAEGAARVEGWRIPAGFETAHWIASPLRRAMETARLMGGTPQPEQRLTEMDWGEWEGRNLTELRADPAAGMAEREARGLDFQPPRGESYRMVQQRLAPLLRDLGGSDRGTVAVCHKGVMLALYALSTGWAMTGPPPEKLKPDRCHLYRVDAAGHPHIDRLNLPLSP